MSASNLIFSSIPETSVQYSNFDLSHDAKLTLNAGSVIPVDIRECLPGETYDIDISQFCRLAPMVFPVMHNIEIFTHTFFVPNRLIYQSWNKFIWQGEGKIKQTNSLPLTDVTPPEFTPNLILNYLTSLKTSNKLVISSPEALTLLFFFGRKYLNLTPTLKHDLEQLHFYLYHKPPTGYPDPKRLKTYTNELTLLPEYLGLHFNIDAIYIASILVKLTWFDPTSHHVKFPPTLHECSQFSNELSKYNTSHPTQLDYDTVSIQPQIPYIDTISEDYFEKLYNLDPQTVAFTTALLIDGALNKPLSALPFRAYLLTWDSYYRYEPIESQINDWNRDEVTNEEALYYFFCRPRAWEHDYFTSALPSRQKGQPLAIPVSSIKATGNMTISPGDTIQGVENELYNSATGEQIKLFNEASALVNDLRTAIKLQSFGELFARCGSRVYEALKGIFNVTSQDARLDTPEYINGSVMPIQISEVTQTSSSTDTSALGDYAGHGIGANKSDHIHYETNEHGFLLTVVSIRPRSEYMDRLSKMWYRRSYLDYAWPQLSQLGEQEIFNYELHPTIDYSQKNDHNQGTFGYIPRYSEYKYAFDTIAGDFRTNSQFQAWTLARRFSQSPNLGSLFISIGNECNRIFAYEDFDFDHYYMQVHFDINARLPLPLYSDPTF